jgi:hypothetical protein
MRPFFNSYARVSQTAQLIEDRDAMLDRCAMMAAFGLEHNRPSSGSDLDTVSSDKVI